MRRTLLAIGATFCVVLSCPGIAWAGEGSSFWDDLKTAGSEIYQDVKEKAPEVYDAAKEAAGNACDYVTDKAPEVYEGVKTKAGEAAEAIQEFRQDSEDEFVDWFEYQTGVKTQSSEAETLGTMVDEANLIAGSSTQETLGGVVNNAEDSCVDTEPYTSQASLEAKITTETEEAISQTFALEDELNSTEAVTDTGTKQGNQDLLAILGAVLLVMAVAFWILVSRPPKYR